MSYNNLTGALPPVPTGLKELYLQGNRFQSGLSMNYSASNNSLATMDLSDNPTLGVSCWLGKAILHSLSVSLYRSAKLTSVHSTLAGAIAGTRPVPHSSCWCSVV
jgi:hypothetical protein